MPLLCIIIEWIEKSFSTIQLLSALQCEASFLRPMLQERESLKDK